MGNLIAGLRDGNRGMDQLLLRNNKDRHNSVGVEILMDVYPG
jgi:hypothetical protein